MYRSGVCTPKVCRRVRRLPCCVSHVEVSCTATFGRDCRPVRHSADPLCTGTLYRWYVQVSVDPGTNLRGTNYTLIAGAFRVALVVTALVMGVSQLILGDNYRYLFYQPTGCAVA